MQKWLKRLIIVAMVVTLSIPLLPASANKIIDKEQDRATVSVPSVYKNTKRVSVHPYPAGYRENTNADKTAPTLPAYYNSNYEGYISPVRDQGQYGTCWAHGAIGACEANMVKKGIPIGGVSALASSINLSEYHLAYFSYTDSYDALNLTKGDKSMTTDHFYNVGGNGEMASYVLMRWAGLASESTPALAYSNIGSGALDSKYAYEENVAHVQDCTWIPSCDINDVKQAIMEYGAGTIGYYHDDAYYNDEKDAYCFIQADGGDVLQSNHDVTLVGWNDGFDKNFFKSTSRPENDGAWIVKGSYSAGFGNAGYYYISYEDTAVLADNCCFYSVEPVDNYDYNYQYDGTINISQAMQIPSGGGVANIFTATGKQTVDAASICIWSPGVSYTCSVYVGSDDTIQLLSSTPVSSVSGTFAYMGYHTVKFDTPVPVNKDERFMVLFTVSAESGNVLVAIDNSDGGSDWMSWKHDARPDVSYYNLSNTNQWMDIKSLGNYRIKAYTKEDLGSVEARSEDETRGTVSVSRKTITATPAAGYKVKGYRIISGEATVTQNGNVFKVETDVDCVIEIQFSRIIHQVTFISPSGITVTYVFELDPIIMRSNQNTAYGSTHVGWTETEIKTPTATAPTFYATGDNTHICLGPVTLYALFSYPSPTDSTVTLYCSEEGPCPHEYHIAILDVAPTCSSAGSANYVCKHCKSTYYGVVPPLPHTPSGWIVDAEATLDADGERHQTCTVCTAVIQTEVIPKLTWANPFRDISDNTWYYTAVRYVNYYGYIKGTNDGSTFEPNTVTTRAMFVNILYRLEKDPATHENRFTDVPDNAWYEPGISWAAGEGVVNGTSPTTFSPNGNLDRQQMATMLYNYAEYKGQDMNATGDYTSFRDGDDVAFWAQDAINWALGRSLISGTSQTERILSPNGQATRATIAVILMKFLKA